VRRTVGIPSQHTHQRVFISSNKTRAATRTRIGCLGVLEGSGLQVICLSVVFFSHDGTATEPPVHRGQGLANWEAEANQEPR